MFNKKFLLCLGLSLWFLSSFGQQSSVTATANIIVLRAEGDLMGNKPVWIYVDGKRQCNVTAGQHVSMSIAAGEHAFRVSFSGKSRLKTKDKDMAVSLNCASAQTTYLLVVSNPANRKSVSCAPIVSESAEKLLLKSSKRGCTAKG